MERLEIRRKLAANQAKLDAIDKKAVRAVLAPHVMTQFVMESEDLGCERAMLTRQLEGLGGPETLRERLETWFGAFERGDTAKDQAAKPNERLKRNEAQLELDPESLAAPLLQKREG